MFRETVNALVACVVTFVVCALVYPAAVWGIGQLAFPHEAEGSLIYDRDRSVIGSELIAQPFASDTYFYSRPSAVDYKADATGGSNLGTMNPDLRKKVIERADALKATEKDPAPVDLVTASGGGMDPHISPESAYYQAVRVATARKMPLEQIKALIERHIERSGLIIGAPARVNVLKLNLALDDEKPAKATVSPAPEPTPVSAGVGHEVDTITTRVDEIKERIGKLGTRIGALSQGEAAADPTRASLKAVDASLSRLTEDARQIPLLAERVNGLDGQVNAVDESLRGIQSDLRETRDALKTLAKSGVGARPTR